MKFSIKDFFSKYDQIRSFLRIWSHSLKKSLMESFIFCAVIIFLFILTFILTKLEFGFYKSHIYGLFRLKTLLQII